MDTAYVGDLKKRVEKAGSHVVNIACDIHPSIGSPDDESRQKAIDLALTGDIPALRLCLDRILPPRKDRPVSFDSPLITSAKDAAAVVNARYLRPFALFKGGDGLLYAVVQRQAVLRELGLALDDEPFQSR